MRSLKEQFNTWKFLRSWRPYFVIITLGFLLYSQTLFFNLTYLDDNTLIVDNYELINDFKNIPKIFSSDAFFSGTNYYYRPMLNLSFMIDAQIAGDNFYAYHLDNILLHLLATCLVFLLLKKIISRKAVAFFLSLIFLVHPAISQAVAWLPGRNDSLVAIFVLLSFLYLFKFAARPRLGSLIIYTVFFFLALLTKETAIFLPLLAIVYLFSLGRQSAVNNQDKFLVGLFSLFAGIIWFLMRNLAFGGENVSIGEALQSLGANLVNAVVLGSKVILPFNLSVLPVAADSSFWWSLAAIPALVIALFVSRKKNLKVLLFGLAWFLIFFLPPFVISSAAPYILEHRLYLPLIGFLIIIAEIDWIKKMDFTDKKTKIITLIVLLLLAGLTFFHSQNFRDRFTFWQSAVKTSPHSPLAQKNLGAMYYLDGHLNEALPYYLKSLELNPQESMANNNIGLIYYELGRYEEAEKYFLQELSLYPYYDKALFNLGVLYYQQKNFPKAQLFLEKTLIANPRYYAAYQYLQNIQEKQGSTT